jgi:hypothetical protein
MIQVPLADRRPRKLPSPGTKINLIPQRPTQGLRSGEMKCLSTLYLENIPRACIAVLEQLSQPRNRLILSKNTLQ